MQVFVIFTVGAVSRKPNALVIGNSYVRLFVNIFEDMRNGMGRLKSIFEYEAIEVSDFDIKRLYYSRDCFMLKESRSKRR